MMPLCTTRKVLFGSERCGCELTSDGGPCVAQRVCAMPTWFTSTSCMLSVLSSAQAYVIRATVFRHEPTPCGEGPRDDPCTVRGGRHTDASGPVGRPRMERAQCGHARSGAEGTQRTLDGLLERLHLARLLDHANVAAGRVAVDRQAYTHRAAKTERARVSTRAPLTTPALLRPPNAALQGTSSKEVSPLSLSLSLAYHLAIAARSPYLVPRLSLPLASPFALPGSASLSLWLVSLSHTALLNALIY